MGVAAIDIDAFQVRWLQLVARKEAAQADLATMRQLRLTIRKIP